MYFSSSANSWRHSEWKWIIRNKSEMPMVVWTAVEVHLKVSLWSEIKYPVILRPIHIVTWSALPLSCLSICYMYQCSSQLMDFHDIWQFGTSMKVCNKNSNLVKGRQKHQALQRSRYVLLLPGTLNCHKSTLFNWNGMKLLVPSSNCLLSVGISWAPTWHICMKFDIGT